MGRRTGRARRGFSMYHEDDVIYSYETHFPIARFINPPLADRTAKSIVLITSRRYSVSTAKHVGIVWRALDYGHGSREVIRVDNVMATSMAEHEGNLDGLRQEADECRLRASRACLHSHSTL